MTPSFSRNNSVYGVPMNIIFFGEKHNPSTMGMFFSYFKNLYFCKFSFSVIFSKVMSFFGDLFQSIFFICSCSKMFAFYASTIITGMKNVKFSRYPSVIKNVGDAMSTMESTTDDNLSVTTRIKRPSPVPTSLSFFYRFPESIFHSIDVVGKDVFHGCYVHG